MPRDRTATWVDAIACLIFASLSFVSYRAARHAADEAVRLYGHNVDSGAYLAATVVIYLAPAALLLGIAAAVSATSWRWRVVPHTIAWLFVVYPCFIGLFYGIKSSFGL